MHILRFAGCTADQGGSELHDLGKLAGLDPVGGVVWFNLRDYSG